MNIAKHDQRLKESLEVIDESITKGLTKRQRTIGFNCSAAACDLLEIFFHMNNLIDPGFVIKHEWFKSKNRIKEKFPFQFLKKEEILTLMKEIEDKRNELCYGIPKEEKIIKEVLIKFNELKQLFKDVGVKVET